MRDLRLCCFLVVESSRSVQLLGIGMRSVLYIYSYRTPIKCVNTHGQAGDETRVK